MDAGTEKMAMMKLFNDLAGYTKTHFRDEEKVMQDIGYPGLAEHKEQHAELNRRLAGNGTDRFTVPDGTWVGRRTGTTTVLVTYF
jgi:hemerythrin-like metal-binding protein